MLLPLQRMKNAAVIITERFKFTTNLNYTNTAAHDL